MILYLFALMLFLSAFCCNSLANDSIYTKRVKVSAYGIIILSLFLCVCIGGFRWETGTDWINYFSFFDNNSTWKSFSEDNSFEIGWKIFNFGIKQIWNNYTLLLLVFHFLILFFTILAIKNFKKVFSFDIFLFFLLNFAAHKGDFFSTRQMLAMSIMFFSISLYLNKRLKLSLLFAIISVSIHISTIIMFFLPIVQKINIKRFGTFLLLVLVLIFFYFGHTLFFNLLDIAINYISNPHIIGKLVTYSGMYKNVSSRIGYFSLFRLVMFVPFIYHSYKKSSVMEKAIYNDYFFGICLYIICGSIMPILLRIPQNLINLESLVLCIYFKKLPKNLFKSLFLLLIIVYAIFKFVYGIYGEYSSLYLPYYSIFNKGIRDLY